jgi:histidinol-phosphate/aromatic aminotransferase/cobyric acid decarboxylase-like protein
MMENYNHVENDLLNAHMRKLSAYDNEDEANFLLLIHGQRALDKRQGRQRASRLVRQANCNTGLDAGYSRITYDYFLPNSTYNAQVYWQCF